MDRHDENVPDYFDLPTVGDTGERSAWGVFGADDNFGCLNFLTEERVAAAARLVRTGRSFGLDLPLGEPQPQFWAMRPSLQHSVRVHRHGRDDHLNSFYMQGSTQWDGLRHVRFRKYGYYGGVDEAQLDTSDAIGIDHWAQRGIIGRGVLVDVANYLASLGRPIDPTHTLEIDVALIEATLAHQGVRREAGDILLVRSGWLAWYTRLSAEQRQAIVTNYEADRSSFHAPGVDPTLKTVAWLWNSRTAAVAIDTPTFEVLPFDPDRGWAHHRMLALLGLPLGELWWLEDLSRHCREVAQYDFFLTSSPLRLPKGVGTPANAHAIF